MFSMLTLVNTLRCSEHVLSITIDSSGCHNINMLCCGHSKAGSGQVQKRTLRPVM